MLQDNYKENVSSRYLQPIKKKYMLANVEHNVEQLKEEQIKELTSILISLKSEYDCFIRESLLKKKQTDEISKQIDMLEKMEKKTKTKISEMQDTFTNMEALIKLKEVKKNEEFHTRMTLLNMIEKMKGEMTILKKDVTVFEGRLRVIKVEHENVSLTKNSIEEKVNQIYSVITQNKQKNNTEKNEYDLTLQYYNTIIEQKWAFINSSDERKVKQMKIAIEAKNDSQDKQEVEKRKILFLCMLYDKYLKRKMESELKENENVEEVFQKIRQITGNSNLKAIVDKILNKDKSYNVCVAKVGEKQIRIEILNKDIKKLEEDLQRLKNDLSEEYSREERHSFITASTFRDESDTALIEEEASLIEELKAIQEKHKNVKLAYENVTENIKTICKLDAKPVDNNVNTSNNYNLNESRQETFNQSLILTEDDMFKSYSEYLENLKKSAENIIAEKTKEDFHIFLREKGYNLPATNHQGQRAKKRSATKIMERDNFSKIKSDVNSVPEDYEFFEKLRKEEDDIQCENEKIVNVFKEMDEKRVADLINSDNSKKK